MLGHPDAAMADAEHAMKLARGTGEAASLMSALYYTSITRIHCGNYAAASVEIDELLVLAEEKGSLFWKAVGMLNKGYLAVLTGKALDAVEMINLGLPVIQPTGNRALFAVSYLARAHAALGHFDDAARCIGQAMTDIEETNERWWEASVYQIAGEIAFKNSSVNKAEGYFHRALAVAREQQAKCWELRAAMSMARLWRDQRKRQEARELLAPVYGWFTEGFDTLDLKEAKTLLDELAA
jgi:predicted ATPase